MENKMTKNSSKVYITQIGILLKSRGLADNKGLQKMAYRAQSWEILCWNAFLFCILSKGSLEWKEIQEK